MWAELTKIVRRHADPRGVLVAWEGSQVPFPIARVFFLAELPAGAVRGGHAHRECHELVVCLSGKLNLTLRTPDEAARFVLDRPELGLHVRPGLWIDIEVEAPGTVAAVFCSHVFEEADYLREWGGFVDFQRSREATP